MQHQESQEKRLLGRRFWHEWSGWAGTPLETTIDEMLPCLESIMAITGEAPPPNFNLGEACGKTRFCVRCETVLNKFAHSWRVPLMADVTIALLRKSIETWADGRAWGAPMVAVHTAAPLHEPTRVLNQQPGVSSAPLAAQVQRRTKPAASVDAACHFTAPSLPTHDT
jgi:hypothetical protein